ASHVLFMYVFFFQAEDGIRDRNVTGVQTCALPISIDTAPRDGREILLFICDIAIQGYLHTPLSEWWFESLPSHGRGCCSMRNPEIGRASCRERVENSGVGGAVKSDEEWCVYISHVM